MKIKEPKQTNLTGLYYFKTKKKTEKINNNSVYDKFYLLPLGQDQRYPWSPGIPLLGHV